MIRRLKYSAPILALPLSCAAASPQTTNSVQQTVVKSNSEPKKWTEADERYLLAKSQQGDASSQMWLACGYEQGWFGKTDIPEALRWFRNSAEQGNPDAQYLLGQMYEEGEGVSQNFSMAAKLYRKAAEHDPDLGGAGQGRYHLGLLYLDGNGVPKDYVQAYFWLRLAEFESDPHLSTAKAQMTPEQILEAERLVEEWKFQNIKTKCPITQPPRKPFAPPSPYPSENSPDGFWFGSEKLWIQLPTNGTWSHLGHYEPTDTAFRQKLQWWRAGYDWRNENPPQLTVTGKRLDSPSPPLRSDDHANATGLGDHPSMMTGVFFPTLGCWQVTGDYKGDKLTFVIWVTR